MVGLKGLFTYLLYKILYFRLLNFKSTLQLIEWSNKESKSIENVKGYLLLEDLPSFANSNFYFRPFSSDSLVVKQHFFARELSPVVTFFKSISHVPKLMFDAGGNIGAASRFIQLHYPTMKSIVVEPSRENCEMVRMNLSDVDYRLFPNALWYQPESLFLDQNREAWGIRVSSFSGKGTTVGALTIQAILNEAGWGDPDYLKIDIEGAEEAIFQKDSGLKQVLEKVRCVTVEPHSQDGEKVIKRVLADCGFAIENHGELIYGFRYS